MNCLDTARIARVHAVCMSGTFDLYVKRETKKVSQDFFKVVANCEDETHLNDNSALLNEAIAH